MPLVVTHKMFNEIVEKAACNLVNSILSDLDLTVMEDITCAVNCQQCKDEEDHFPKLRCYTVGWPQELGAGLRGGTVSPVFLDEKELMVWVIGHEKQLSEYIDALSYDSGVSSEDAQKLLNALLVEPEVDTGG